MNGPTLYLVCGLPGAGKTTRARRIVSRERAVHVCPDEWVLGLGMSLVDYEFRAKLQDCMLVLAERILQCKTSVVVEFGSWSREERTTIRRVAVRQGATSELHFLDAPLLELVRRVRERGGPAAEALANVVLMKDSSRFERPTQEEQASFDRYFGPEDRWPAEH